MTNEDANKQLYLYKPEQCAQEHLYTSGRSGHKTALN